MEYDSNNDKLISECGNIEIYPGGLDFPRSMSISIEILGEHVEIPGHMIRQLADGILNAADRIGV